MILTEKQSMFMYQAKLNSLARFTLWHEFWKPKQSQIFEQGIYDTTFNSPVVYIIQRSSKYLRNGWLLEMTNEIMSFTDFQKQLWKNIFAAGFRCK